MLKKSMTVTFASIVAITGLNTLAHAQQTHIVKEKTNVEILAQQFSTTADEIKKLNHITNDEIEKDASIVVPDKDIVEVKSGDTLNKIAKAYHLTLDELYAFNPGVTPLIHPGDLIAVSDKGSATLESQLISDSDVYTIPYSIEAAPLSYNSTETGAYVAPSSYVNSSNYNTETVSAPVYYNSSALNNQGNHYYFGNCTYYAFDRRQQLGRSVGSYWGNANNWANSARSAGLVVDHRPEVGAIFQTTAGYYGHVGVVERVNNDGSFYVSEMNWNGHFNDVTNRTIHSSSGYNFIH
ncbi:surface antigen [Staphylococcus hominis]